MLLDIPSLEAEDEGHAGAIYTQSGSRTPSMERVLDHGWETGHDELLQAQRFRLIETRRLALDTSAVSKYIALVY